MTRLTKDAVDQSGYFGTFTPFYDFLYGKKVLLPASFPNFFLRRSTTGMQEGLRWDIGEALLPGLEPQGEGRGSDERQPLWSSRRGGLHMKRSILNGEGDPPGGAGGVVGCWGRST